MSKVDILLDKYLAAKANGNKEDMFFIAQATLSFSTSERLRWIEILSA